MDVSLGFLLCLQPRCLEPSRTEALSPSTALTQAWPLPSKHNYSPKPNAIMYHLCPLPASWKASFLNPGVGWGEPFSTQPGCLCPSRSAKCLLPSSLQKGQFPGALCSPGQAPGSQGQRQEPIPHHPGEQCPAPERQW